MLYRNINLFGYSSLLTCSMICCVVFVISGRNNNIGSDRRSAVLIFLPLLSFPQLVGVISHEVERRHHALLDELGAADEEDKENEPAYDELSLDTAPDDLLWHVHRLRNIVWSVAMPFSTRYEKHTMRM